MYRYERCGRPVRPPETGGPLCMYRECIGARRRQGTRRGRKGRAREGAGERACAFAASFQTRTSAANSKAGGCVRQELVFALHFGTCCVLIHGSGGQPIPSQHGTSCGSLEITPALNLSYHPEPSSLAASSARRFPAPSRPPPLSQRSAFSGRNAPEWLMNEKRTGKMHKGKHRGSPSHPQAPDAVDREKIPLSPERTGTSATTNQSAARRGHSRPPGPQHPPGERSSRNSPASRVRVFLVPAAQRRPREPSKLY
ncbi:uncharacterized protein LOC135268953 [Aotus nancymaae]|uniref:uncharacterized protein LOC135268953 n=1 Tax=Aotus nancymaae TaxID=37293 RepID=UPI0030FE2F4A